MQQVTEGFRGAGAAAQQVGMSLEDQLLVQGVFADVGRRGAQGGTATRIFTASLAQGFDRLNMDLIRRDDGTLDVAANLRAVQALNLDFNEMNRVFTRRGATAITQQISGIDKLDSGLGQYKGTALENALEHVDTWESTMKDLAAAQDVVNATMGLGVMKVRGVDAAMMQFFARTLADAPGLATGAGVALEVGSRVGQLGVGVLDAMVGVHAFKQLAGGTVNPMNLFRSQESVDARRTARRDRRGPQAEMRAQRRVRRGVRTTGRQWSTMFAGVNQRIGRTRAGFSDAFDVADSGMAKMALGAAAVLAIATTIVKLGDLKSAYEADKEVERKATEAGLSPEATTELARDVQAAGDDGRTLRDGARLWLWTRRGGAACRRLAVRSRSCRLPRGRGRKAARWWGHCWPR